MNPTLDRIQKLLRLATNNPNDAEARSAALAAAKLIMEHKCVLSMPVAISENRLPPKPPHQASAYYGYPAPDIEDDWVGRFYDEWKNR